MFRENDNESAGLTGSSDGDSESGSNDNNGNVRDRNDVTVTMVMVVLVKKKKNNSNIDDEIMTTSIMTTIPRIESSVKGVGNLDLFCLSLLKAESEEEEGGKPDNGFRCPGWIAGTDHHHFPKHRQ
ncbi:hypothetical protein LOAG_01635 [Loa loa]|uniref:Uncharacterized protein n=1 Tax=Loa loa TaxID=7209 RepID=A0A1S0UAJ2_LOALO|nr:hypothetical protein LOAG_01635 [Loa loa]EFO26853.1 hypothetical protein LOAG_01635 [Loa loa]